MARHYRPAATKLTDEQAEEIRVRYAAGGVSQYQLGHEFGLSGAAVGMIIRGRTYRPLHERQTCVHGHALEQENVYLNTKGIRECRECRRRRSWEYCERHRVRVRLMLKASKRRRKAQLHGVEATLTKEEWDKIKEVFGYRCYYCGREDVPLEQEHKTPLSRGGPHTRENVVPACRRCNMHKHTRTESEYRAAMLALVSEPGASS